ncbi:membrane protein [Novosphingobium marinum]|uniref:NfeD-like C-terminal domain-containing protein n=1 Tax=Novosphingobium marinum TaxID=1514948 RepID=A0A7Z0BUE2_9SPHN|nr:NfeD family protein [Novosphingobium marinum]NYH95103.1 hypothetical protein [Novosphingobium marinum]GGC24288.1 membrane protein [Novosphingobium marinum]
MDWINDLAPHWIWLALGVFLAAAEIAVPGTFLIWMAGAAIITGIAAWLLPIGLFVQIMLFAALAIAAVFLGRRYLRDNPIEAFDPKMNDRGARIMGETVVVVTAIQGGTGRVRLGDSEWLAKGADAAPGTRLRVAGHDGVVLIVEPIA